MPNVLIVDDSAVDRQVAGGLLAKSSELTLAFAADGAEALRSIQKDPPDLVVADLLMPRVDGLELVEKIRMQRPGLPVVVMTARGSETLAIRALKRGAAGYVPKSQLAAKLRSTVEEVLEQARASQTYARLMACQERAEFSYALENDAALIDALVDLVKQIVAGMGLCDHTGRFRVGLAFREALLNALYRGNLEIGVDQLPESRVNARDPEQVRLVRERLERPPYCDRRIHAAAQITRDEARFVVRDEGPGFDHESARSRDLSGLESLDAIPGRGLVLIHSFMDEVAYNRAGNEITMVKRRE